MYQSNRSFSIPPPANPQAFEFLENFCSNSPLTGSKSCSNAPTPGKITRLLFQLFSSFYYAFEAVYGKPSMTKVGWVENNLSSLSDRDASGIELPVTGHLAPSWLAPNQKLISPHIDTQRTRNGQFSTSALWANWLVVGANVPVKLKLQHAHPGHTLGIWQIFLPGREGIWSLLIGGGEFDR